MAIPSFRAFLHRSYLEPRLPLAPTLNIPTKPSLVQPSRRWGRAYATATETLAGPRKIKVSYVFAAAILLGSSSYILGSVSPPSFVQIVNPRPAPPPLPADSDEGKQYVAKIEKELQSLDMVRQFRDRKDVDEWYETRPYTQMPRERLVNNLTAGALRGPGKLAVPPLVMSRKDETETWAFFHIGRGVCGHDGIVHGGLLATILDEGCGRNAVLSFPSKLAVTANLNLDYKAPTKADQFVVLKTRLVELKGRKAIIEGRIEDTNGNLLVQARALFIEPKVAHALSSGAISAIFPTAGSTVAQMAGTPNVEGGGQVADIGSVKGET